MGLVEWNMLAFFFYSNLSDLPTSVGRYSIFQVSFWLFIALAWICPPSGSLSLKNVKISFVTSKQTNIIN